MSNNPLEELSKLADAQFKFLNREIMSGNVGWVADPDPAVDTSHLVQKETGLRVHWIDGQAVMCDGRIYPAKVVFSVGVLMWELVNNFERFITHMYQDSRGNVTAGVGTKLSSVQDAINSFSWSFHPPKSTKSGTPSTADIKRDFNNVKNAPKGRRARAYKKFTVLEVDRQSAILRARQELLDHQEELWRGTPIFLKDQFETFPEGAQLALSDFAYNPGKTIISSTFPMFKAACQRRDWLKARLESSRKGLNADRNDKIAEWLQDSVEDFYISYDADISRQAVFADAFGTFVKVQMA